MGQGLKVVRDFIWIVFYQVTQNIMHKLFCSKPSTGKKKKGVPEK
jgi:hypothetical protein